MLILSLTRGSVTITT